MFSQKSETSSETKTPESSTENIPVSSENLVIDQPTLTIPGSIPKKEIPIKEKLKKTVLESLSNFKKANNITYDESCCFFLVGSGYTGKDKTVRQAFLKEEVDHTRRSYAYKVSDVDYLVYRFMEYISYMEGPGKKGGLLSVEHRVTTVGCLIDDRVDFYLYFGAGRSYECF